MIDHKQRFSNSKAQRRQGVAGEQGLTGKIYILRCGPELGEDILVKVIGNGEEAENAATRVIDKHHSQRRPHLTCIKPLNVSTIGRATADKCSALQCICQQFIHCRALRQALRKLDTCSVLCCHDRIYGMLK